MQRVNVELVVMLKSSLEKVKVKVMLSVPLLVLWNQTAPLFPENVNP